MQGVSKAQKAVLFNQWYHYNKNKTTPWGNPNHSESEVKKDNRLIATLKRGNTPEKEPEKPTAYGKYYNKKTGQYERPSEITFRNGKTMSLKNLSEKERNFILANAKGVRSIKYEHYLIKKKAKENVKKKIKDNSELPEDNSTGSGGGGYSRRGRSWRHYYRRGGGGGRVSMPDTLSPAKEKITDVTYRSPLSLTVEQPSKKSDLRKIMKAYRNNFSKFKV